MASPPAATPIFLLLFLLVQYTTNAFKPLPSSPFLSVRGMPASSKARWAKETAAKEKAAVAAAAAAASTPVVVPSARSSVHLEAPTRIQDLVRLLHESEDPLWELVKFEAETSAAQDEKAAGLIQLRVLDQGGIYSAARDFLATKLQSSNVPTDKIKLLIDSVFQEEPDIIQDFREDLLVATMRDSSIPSLLAAFLFSKGYHAVATYRIAHSVYCQGRESLARYLQSLNSELFGADIHPACSVGRALYLSSGTCVVIGETAKLGDDIILMQGVTLGGNGKERGDRHPKLGSGVLVAAGSTVLGNIPIGDGVIISAGSVVLRPVPEYTRCSGVPAKVTSVLRKHKDNVSTIRDKGQSHFIEIFQDPQRGG
ncbi:serine acetyltransferase [Nannochloropsis oceanica]